MAINKLITFILIGYLFVSIVSCHNLQKPSFTIESIDSIPTPIQIPIKGLARHYKKYQGQYIETVGRFYGGFEDFAIYPDKTIFESHPNGFWLDVDRHLQFGPEYWSELCNSKIKIRGWLDTSTKGHLGGYLATIKRINFLEEQ